MRTFLAVAAVVAGLQASADDASAVRWIDGRDLPLEGRAFDDVAHDYDRLPKGLSPNVNANVHELLHDSAGMQFRFRTDSRTLRLKWTTYRPVAGGGNMSWYGESAIDVYRRCGTGDWQFVTAALSVKPDDPPKTLPWKPGDDCLVNLPLYNGIRTFSLGVDAGASVEPLPPRASGVDRPVVFYGTSITQGGCASRPGTSFVNMIGRDLDVPVVNLGFSGSGLMEYELSDVLARIDASCFVLDCLPNMNDDLVARRYEPFIRNLRAKRPAVPIVMAEEGDVFSRPCNGKDKAIRALFEKLKQEGWTHLFYLPKTDMYAGAAEGSVDTIHPNELGMVAFAKVYGKVVKEALGLSERTSHPPHPAVRPAGTSHPPFPTVCPAGRAASPLAAVFVPQRKQRWLNECHPPHRALAERLRANELWGGRPTHPAVVNPVVGWDAENMLSLRGDWQFRTLPRRETRQHRGGVDRLTGANVAFERTIRVPAAWEAEGVGEPNGGAVWDLTNDATVRPLRHAFVGWGHYRRTVTIPERWKGRRIWLKVGGVSSRGWFFVNGNNVAICDEYCGTYKYEITDLVRAGQSAQIDVQVSNVPPGRKGQACADQPWGGIVRDVELEATPATLIDDCWVRGDFDGRKAEVKVAVDGQERLSGLRLRATVEGETAEVPLASARASYDLSLPLGAFRPWSPEHPNLYTARVDLVASSGEVLQSRYERFGVRKLEVRGKEFFLNGRPFFFRGYGHHNTYPIEGYVPADRETHRRQIGLMRASGFNAMRTHTRCPPPEHFDAADELGVLVQAELPYYNDQETRGFSFDPERDVVELWQNMRRHPSFAVYSMGNEGSFGPTGDAALHRLVKAMDPDRLKINQDSDVAWVNPPESSDYCGGPSEAWPRGSFEPGRPFVCHEYCSASAKVDPRDEDLFTGVWRAPVTKAARNDWLKRFGLDAAWGDRLMDGQHALQSHFQRTSLESARLDPACDGYHYWAAVDCCVEQVGTFSGNGLFGPFFNVKSRGLTPQEIARFNSADAVLADLGSFDRVLVSGDRFAVDVSFAHYSERDDLTGVSAWRLVGPDARPLASGSLPPFAGCAGPARKLTTLAFVVPDVERPLAVRLVLSVSGVESDWPLWVFPRRARRTLADVAVADVYRDALALLYDGLMAEADVARAKTVIAPLGSELAAASLRRGQRVLALGSMRGRSLAKPGWWWMGPLVGSALTRSPAFGDLPHDGVLSPLLFRIASRGLKLPIRGLDPQDVFMVDEGATDCRLHLAQAKCARGKIVLLSGLDVLSGKPEGTTLLDGVLAYMGSDAFAPVGTIDVPKTSIRSAFNGYDGGDVTAAKYILSDLPDGVACFEHLDGQQGSNAMAWQTARVPADAAKAPTHTFRFQGAMRFWAEPPLPLTVFADGVKAVDVPDLAWTNAVWRTGDCTLKYVKGLTGDVTGDYGTFELTLPTSRLVSGRKVAIEVRAPANGSTRAFGLAIPDVESTTAR